MRTESHRRSAAEGFRHLVHADIDFGIWALIRREVSGLNVGNQAQERVLKLGGLTQIRGALIRIFLEVQELVGSSAAQQSADTHR